MAFVENGEKRGNKPRGGRARAAARPRVEPLEKRDLPSHAAIAPHPHQGSAQISQIHAETATARVGSHHGLFGSQPPGPFLNPAVIAQSANLLYGPNSLTPMTPTPQEIKREIFTARWAGHYTIGPPRFNDRANTIHLYGVEGGSNAFLKGKFQIALFPPSDPNATPNPGSPYAGQTTGVAGLIPQNFLQSGGLLVLDIHGVQGVADANSAMPTHLTWTFDVDSGGPFLTATDFTQGTGTLNIVYRPDRHAQPGTMGSGTAIVTFQGLYNYIAIASSVSKYYS